VDDERGDLGYKEQRTATWAPPADRPAPFSSETEFGDLVAVKVEVEVKRLEPLGLYVANVWFSAL
jgi:hypothetical protein